MAYPKGVIIVDADTGIPLPKASVFDKKGNLVGVCSDDGKMPYVSSSSYPLTVRYMGYATITIDNPTYGNILLHHETYELPEITINSKDHQVLHILGYVREYSTLSTYSDTVLLFREKTVDFMLPTKKVKNYRGWSYRVFSPRDHTITLLIPKVLTA